MQPGPPASQRVRWQWPKTWNAYEPPLIEEPCTCKTRLPSGVFRVAARQRPFFNVEGTLDLVLAISLATIYRAAPHMGPAYWIPAFWVPALLVTHYVVFVVLGRRWSGPL